MSIEQVGPRKWRVRVQYRDPRTGRSRSLERIVDGSRREAAAKEVELRGRAKSAGERRPRQKLRTFARSWLASRVGSLKPSVALKYATSLDRHVLPALGDLYLDAITHTDVQDYVNARAAASAGNTVLNELRLIRTISRDSFADGAAPRHWGDRVKPPTIQGYSEERPNMLTADQLGLMLAKVPEQWSLLVALMAFTGLRWGEVSALKWGDVDFYSGELRIRRGNWKGREVAAPKTERSRRKVPIPAALTSQLMEGTPEVERTGRTAEVLVFPARAGGLHKGTPLRKVLQQACAAADVPVITPHGLRRTFNDLLRRVADKEVAKAIIGHTTDAMHSHYSRIDSGEKAEATRRVEELVGRKGEE